MVDDAEMPENGELHGARDLSQEASRGTNAGPPIRHAARGAARTCGKPKGFASAVVAGLRLPLDLRAPECLSHLLGGNERETERRDVSTTTAAEVERVEKQVWHRYGLDVARRYVELREPALRVRVLECGAGRPVLFVPGDGAVAAAWAPLLGELSGRRALVLDRPSFGLSDPFDYRGADLRPHGVNLLCSLLDALELDAVTIVGSSGGGQWSLWLALDAPDRVRALAPMGMPAVCLPGFRPRAGMRLSSAPGLGPLLFALPSPNAKTTGKMLSPADARLPEHTEIVETYHAAMRLPGYGRSAAAIFRASMRLGGRPRPTMVLSDAELARITQPVMFVWGDQEPFGDPAVARRAASRMPDARVEIVEGGWHHPWLADATGVWNLLRDFLATHDP